MGKSGSVWNSLEAAKLLVSTLLPIALVVIGFQTKEALQERQHEIRIAEAVIAKRKDIYEEIRISLNNIYTYIEEVGSYKRFTPLTINDDRRKLHTAMHTQRAYWSPETFIQYLFYMDEVAFRTWQGVNKDAAIRDDPGQKSSLPGWQNEWSKRFSGPQHPEHKPAYDKLIDLIARDLGANVGG